jgi:hypothetical protein
LSRNNDVNNHTYETKWKSKKKEEEGSSRRRYNDDDDDDNKDMGGRGREGEGREKDDGTTTVVRDMGNIRAYLPAMMTGGTTTRTFPSSRRRIPVRRPTTFSPWPYRHQPSRRCRPRRRWCRRRR